MRRLILSTLVISIAFVLACSGVATVELVGGEGGASSIGGGSGGGGSGAAGQGGAGGVGNGGTSGIGGFGGAPCATQSAEATTRKRPVDVIFVIDNSGSMTQELETVQDNINSNFAKIIEENGVDYRVIMISRHGRTDDNPRSICVSAPLSGTSCDPIPRKPAFTERFFQYSYGVGSFNSLCFLRETYRSENRSDEYRLAPNGWSAWLRAEAFKVFVMVTDDRVDCETVLDRDRREFSDLVSAEGVASSFEALLFELGPEQFGSPGDRNYVFHSIVGVGEKLDGYTATDPVTEEKCATAASAGQGYQALSLLTGGIRFPVCSTSTYDVVFRAIAQSAIEGAAVPCRFELPVPPEGSELDLSRIALEYTPGDGSPAQRLTRASSEAACDADSFILEGEELHLCPAACARVQRDDQAKVRTLLECSAILE